MIWLDILIILVCGVLWRLGGWSAMRAAWLRDICVPVILGGYAVVTVHWLVGFLTIGSFNIIRMGYGAWDPEHDDRPSWLAKVTRDRQGAIIRGIAGALYGLIGTIVVITYWIGFQHQIGALWAYFGYSTLCASVSYVLCRMKAKDFIIEPLIGMAVGSFVLFF